MSTRDEVLQKTSGKCWYCGQQLDLDPLNVNRNSYAIDHVIPRIQGGTHQIDNLVPACWSCNSRKGGMNLEQYRYYLACKKAKIVTFTTEQIEWLQAHGITLPSPVIEPYLFYGEIWEGSTR